MSDMSFNQAKQIVERMELSEVALKKSTKNIIYCTKKIDETMKNQETFLKKNPINDKKISLLKLIVAGNMGLIIGLIIGKCFL